LGQADSCHIRDKSEAAHKHIGPLIEQIDRLIAQPEADA
jgi:hypothetical protein